MSNINPFLSSVDPASTTENSCNYVLDFSTLPFNTFVLGNPRPSTPYLNTTGAPVSGSYSLVNLTLPQPGSNWGNIRSVIFQFRPAFGNSFAGSPGNDYNLGGAASRYTNLATAILYNNRTFQSLFIRANRLPIVSATVGGATTSYMPYMLNVQGAAPFFANMQDNLEVFCLNSSNSGTGKLILNFYNFDVPPWYETNFDQLIAAT